MTAAEKALAAQVQRWLAQAAQTDKAEDRQVGPERRGDEMPAWVADKQLRLEKIRTAKAAPEAEAQAAARASMALEPAYTVGHLATMGPYRRTPRQERLFAAMRQAGLP